MPRRGHLIGLGNIALTYFDRLIDQGVEPEKAAELVIIRQYQRLLKDVINFKTKAGIKSARFNREELKIIERYVKDQHRS